MTEQKYLMSGILAPVDINSEEFKKEADERWKKTKKQGYSVITDSKEHANLTLKEIDELYKDARIISDDHSD